MLYFIIEVGTIQMLALVCSVSCMGESREGGGSLPTQADCTRCLRELDDSSVRACKEASENGAIYWQYQRVTLINSTLPGRELCKVGYLPRWKIQFVDTNMSLG